MGKGHQLNPALDLLEDMLLESLHPDVITFGAAISACEKGHQHNLALDLLNMLRKSLRPNYITFNATISTCERNQQFDLELELLMDMLLHRRHDEHDRNHDHLHEHCPGNRWQRRH